MRNGGEDAGIRLVVEPEVRPEKEDVISHENRRAGIVCKIGS
jgi:hypothetical protein